MRFGIVMGLVCALALVGCNKAATDNESRPPSPTASAPVAGMTEDTAARGFAGKPQATQQQQLMAYSHAMWLISEPATVQAHFERARDRCLNDTALNCILVSGAANAGDEMANEPPSAQLVVSLPHEQVAPFEKALLVALPGRAADIKVRQQSLEAENVTQAAVDIDRRVTQLATYRDRLSAIAERNGVKADDLITLEEKISEIQSELDELAAQKTTLGERVHRERVAVTFTSRTTVTEAERPLARAWDNSFEVLGESASAVLLLVVTLLPWLPVAGLVWLVVWLVRRNAKRRKQGAQPSVVAPSP